MAVNNKFIFLVLHNISTQGKRRTLGHNTECSNNHQPHISNQQTTQLGFGYDGRLPTNGHIVQLYSLLD